ncbi:MFS general substrate transporter [Ascobolus immersus RN42]|uniref:MFS general substrate transporter n=1 Tax=Ascobolus immersus RN42 TaxID=1160509 RepID=A0A3N4IL66_ASCIM|nr:MFS general substrate transporter [Ascobolus immersus RN42]
MELSDQPQQTVAASTSPEVADTTPTVLPNRPFLLNFRCHKWFVTVTVTIAVFTDIFLYAIVIPVFPYELEDRVGVSEEGLQGMISMLLAAYGIGLIIFSVIAGWLADKWPERRTPLLVGLFVLTGSTVMLCVARNYALMFVGRLLQGGSSGVVWTVGLALLVDTVGTKQIGNAMGTVLLGMSMGHLIAPPLGGVVYEHGGYYAVFGMCFGLLAIDIFLRIILIERKDAIKFMTRDEIIALGGPAAEELQQRELLAESGNEKAEEPTVEQTTVEVNTSGKRDWAQILPAFIYLLKYPRLLAALFASLVQALAMTGLESTLPLHVEQNFGFGPSAAGFLFFATVIPTFISPVAGMFVDKYGARWIAAFGFFLAAPFWILLRLPDGSADNKTIEVVKLCTFMAFIGFGLCLGLTTLAEVQLFLDDLERDHPGLLGKNGATAQGYGLYNVAFSIGTVVGPIWAGFLRKSAGWQTMTWTFGLLLFLTSVPIALFTGGNIFEKRKREKEAKQLSTDTDQEDGGRMDVESKV